MRFFCKDGILAEKPICTAGFISALNFIQPDNQHIDQTSKKSRFIMQPF